MLDDVFKRYCFQSKEVKRQFYFYAVGTKVSGISKTNIAKLRLPLPPLPEQRAIAAALSHVDALIASLETLIAKKRDIKTAAMQQLLTGKRRLPGFSGEWEEKLLGEIAPLQRGFDLPTSQIREGQFPVVYSNGILNRHETYMVRAPGIVTGRSGTIGNVHYVDEDYWPHNTSLWVTNFNGNHPRFIYFLYLHIKLDRFSSGSGVPTLNRNDVHAHKVAIPATLKEQTAIASILSDMDAEITALERRRDKTRALKQGMMEELLTGRIRLL
jgi:type I restriction enzyme S subunit